MNFFKGDTMKIQVLIFFCVSSHLLAYNQMHVSTVQTTTIQPIVASGCDFRGAASLLKNVNFSGAQLAGALFNANEKEETPAAGTIKIPSQTTDLSSVNFSGATLVSTGFKKTVLRNAIFDNADIRYADFTGADLRGAKLDKALNVSLARFDGAIMPDGTKCTGKTWTSASGKQFYCHCSPNK